jgi:ribosome maturation factor RimP
VKEQQMSTTVERERELQDEIQAKVERDLPGIDVLAVELLSAKRFCVYVDHPDGVDHGLCARVTDALREYLREYAIDVSSPGLERPLRKPEHFAGALGHRVAVRALGSSKHRGTVAEATDTHLALDADNGERIQIPYEQIVRANLIDEG